MKDCCRKTLGRAIDAIDEIDAEWSTTAQDYVGRCRNAVDDLRNEPDPPDLVCGYCGVSGEYHRVDCPIVTGREQ